MASPSLVHVAVDKKDLETAQRCAPSVLPAFLALLAKLGKAARHPGLLGEKAIDSVGHYLDEQARAEAARAQLVSGNGVRVEFRSRRFDVMTVEAADKLPSARRRQCVAIRGLKEVARRLDASERGSLEILVTLRTGATLALRQSKRPRRMVVLCTSAQQKKKVLDAELEEADTPALAALFVAAAARGQADASTSSSSSSSTPSHAISRHVKMGDGGFWVLPAWYAEACALIAQDVFRLHALVSSTSQAVSRALFVDCVTAHRIETGTPDKHHTLIKTVLHGASGGCACGLHRTTRPTQAFKRLEMRWEFCGCKLDERGKCPRHYMAEQAVESAAFPKACMIGLKMELHCSHEERQGLRLPLRTNDEKMDLGWAQRFVLDLAACGTRVMSAGAHPDLETDVSQLLSELAAQRAVRGHGGDAMMQRDITAVYMLRRKAAVKRNTGKFVGKVQADCNTILKTHKHLFKMV